MNSALQLLYPLARSALFLLEPEKAHGLALNGLKVISRLGVARPKAVSSLPVTRCMGLDFHGKVGLAAGFDKDGDFIESLSGLGFSFIEVGTITPEPQIGNDRPRIFRLKQHHALINRMGFPSKGLDYLVGRLKSASCQSIIGVNIGKNKVTPNEEAFNDYVRCLKAVYPLCDYITINISSPNTPGLRDLQSQEALQSLLKNICDAREELYKTNKVYRPLCVKLSPDLTVDQRDEVAAVINDSPVDGIIATNTTLDRILVTGSKNADQAGGLSGPPIYSKSLEHVEYYANKFKGSKCVIGCGGISNYESAQSYLNAGANLIQLYTSFVYNGPGFPWKLNNLL